MIAQNFLRRSVLGAVNDSEILVRVESALALEEQIIRLPTQNFRTESTATTLSLTIFGRRYSVTGPNRRRDMDNHRVDELRDELGRLMQEQIESLEAQTYGFVTGEELLKQEERLKRIREVSADLIALMKTGPR
jgi:hypothetical protein